MLNIFNEPKIIGIIADVNEGKSNLIYHLIKELGIKYSFNLYTFGLRSVIENAKVIYSIDELEVIQDSIIFLDEFFTLFDLDNRKKKRQIEATLRLIHHNNNILVLVGLPENFKKFISAKLNCVLFKKVTFADFINGSKVKNTILNYNGKEKGSAVLNIGKDEAILFSGKSYKKFKIPYLKEYDSKKDNKSILNKKKTKKLNK